MASDEVSIDLDAFDEFEASAWEERVEGYAGFFGAVTGRLVEPLWLNVRHRFEVAEASSKGRVVRLDLLPREGSYVLSDLSSGPVLFATC